eukprot:2486456-Rhodomonas_salina.2
MAGRVHTFRANFTALVVALVWSKLVESQEREYPAQVNVVSPLHEGVYQADVKKGRSDLGTAIRKVSC